jgi:hypothetical protein
MKESQGRERPVGSVTGVDLDLGFFNDLLGVLTDMTTEVRTVCNNCVSWKDLSVNAAQDMHSLHSVCLRYL